MTTTKKEETKNMPSNSGLTAYKAANRIHDREDNIYSERVIYDVLKMYMDECQKGLLRGERVQLTGIGTIIPDVKVHERDVRVCEKNCKNLPYTSMKMSRNHSLVREMNQTLQKNIENGILGLEELPFSKQQITILRGGGIISDDESEHNEYEEE